MSPAAGIRSLWLGCLQLQVGGLWKACSRSASWACLGEGLCTRKWLLGPDAAHGSPARGVLPGGGPGGERAAPLRGSSSARQLGWCLPSYPLTREGKVLPRALPWKGCQALSSPLLLPAERCCARRVVWCWVEAGSECPEQRGFPPGSTAVQRPRFAFSNITFICASIPLDGSSVCFVLMPPVRRGGSRWDSPQPISLPKAGHLGQARHLLRDTSFANGESRAGLG